MTKRQKTVPALMDVARKAGVGAATVSRVINGGRNVSPATLARVNAIIQEMGYYPSLAARSLKGARTKTIGLIVPSVADPFFSTAAAAIQDVARQHGTLVLLAASGNDPQIEHEQCIAFLQRRVDGLILVPADDAQHSYFDGLGFPIICFDRPLQGHSVTTVLGDNYDGGRVATEHLIARGYKRILCLGDDPRLFTTHARLQAHRDVIEKAGLPYLGEFNLQNEPATEEAILRHLKGDSPLDAIFSTNSRITVLAYKALRHHGIRIPSQVALLGYDDFELADALDPPISVIHQPVTQIATRAAELLFHEMESSLDDPNDMVTLKVELIERGSC